MKIIGVSGQTYEVIGWGYHPDPSTGKYNPNYCEGYFEREDGGNVHFHNVRKAIGKKLPKWIAQQLSV